jgi:hypothetical protein
VLMSGANFLICLKCARDEMSNEHLKEIRQASKRGFSNLQVLALCKVDVVHDDVHDVHGPSRNINLAIPFVRICFAFWNLSSVHCRFVPLSFSQCRTRTSSTSEVIVQFKSLSY